VITVTGDGSVQWNVQELGTIAYYRLPIKIFVFNNGGFQSIRATQNSFFNGRYVGSDRQSGVGAPDFAHLAAAYGLRYSYVPDQASLPGLMRAFLADDEPGIVEVNVSITQGVSPRTSSVRREDGTMESRPLEDLAPFLSREEIAENMSLFDEQPAAR
jgi:acetolactate synthase-1/2/3 large subunit